ncbi:histone-lysine N-methyltransferase SETMAR [Plakobranchus ocellatus]|uniref:Histone-lysine N-methyltransferase SETMAR n=1 Tax=Plakobranchus ocellatus TaxID=259542 RepID=A0AAV4CBZ7_9GAST|nr:histone-lysine N-methyltransferase SETMAR [Plakobranchus ocellatus]
MEKIECKYWYFNQNQRINQMRGLLSKEQLSRFTEREAIQVWHIKFRYGAETKCPHFGLDKRLCRPLSVSVTAHPEKVDCMIRANRRIKQKEIANAVGILKERMHHIVRTVLGYRKVSARWVPRLLTVEMKAQRKDMCIQLLERYNAEGEVFLQRILTGDESWVHHYDPECNAQSGEFRHKTSPSPRKFKVVASARKVLFTIFWDTEGVVHMEFLEQGQTVNSERYIFQHSELSDSDVFGVIRTQSCNTTMLACTPVGKLRTL